MYQNWRSKLNIVWQWQFIAVVLPVLAMLFFLLLAAFYIRASYNDQTAELSVKLDGASTTTTATATTTTTTVDPILEQAIVAIKSILERESFSKICGPAGASDGQENASVPVTVESVYLMRESQINASLLEAVKSKVLANSRLGIVIDEEGVWDIAPTSLPLWCSVKSYLWNLLVYAIYILVGEPLILPHIYYYN